MVEISCPAYLAGSLRDRWNVLAPPLISAGALDELSADLLAKYILAENEYLKVSSLLQTAINGDKDAGVEPDADEAKNWAAVQDKLIKQILALGAELGITPRARRSRGIVRR